MTKQKQILDMDNGQTTLYYAGDWSKPTVVLVKDTPGNPPGGTRVSWGVVVALIPILLTVLGATWYLAERMGDMAATLESIGARIEVLEDYHR